MIQIKEVTDKKTWDDFLNNPQVINYPFFQSWNWGEVQKKLGNNIVRHGVYNNKKLLAVSQVVDVPARRGHYLHLRHGPVLNPFDPKVFHELIEFTKNLAHERGASFIRMSAVVEKHLVPLPFLKQLGFLPAPLHNMDAEICWVVDITKDEESLLKEMRKSHRYLIKKALENNDIKIIKTTNPKDIEKFIPLYKHLAQRKHFVPHRGVKEELEVFGTDNQSMLFLAEYRKKIISGALIAFVGQMAIYRHSASDENYRDIPAMHLIQWEAIKEAKKRGIKIYNLWGIAPDNKPNHPWKGLTLFKTGFGGEKREFLHAQDLPLSIMYWKTYVIEYVSKLMKGY